MFLASSSEQFRVDHQLFIMRTLQLRVNHWDRMEVCFQEVGERMQAKNRLTNNMLRRCRHKRTQFNNVGKFRKIQVANHHTDHRSLQ
jgi:hypothetical protein